MADEVEDTRKPTAFLSYNGDVTSILESNDRPKGPSYMGEWWFPITAEYIPEINKTRVGFTLIPPPQAE